MNYGRELKMKFHQKMFFIRYYYCWKIMERYKSILIMTQFKFMLFDYFIFYAKVV